MSSLSQTLPRPPSILLDLYGLPASEATHPSIYEESREASLFTPSNDENRPYVTLTFAQSLDAKIAGAGGKQLILSGKESMVMTHWMRTLHDAIVVGIGTALNDNPQLNTRHLPPLPEEHALGYRIPRPVILDTHLRLPPTCKLLQNYQAGRGRRPWVVCAHRTGSRNVADNEAFTKRAAALQKAGGRIVEVDADEATGAIAIPALLSALRELGVRSVMVEGGARVIRAFLSAAAAAHRSAGSGSGSGDPNTKKETAKAVDALVVTVAPTLVGAAGVGYGTELLADALPTFQHVRTEAFGPDAVTALKVL